MSEGNLKKLEAATTTHFTLLFLLSLLLPACALSADNMRQHLTKQTLIGDVSWPEPDKCLLYRLDVLAELFRADGPTPEIMLPPPEYPRLFVFLNLDDPCQSVPLASADAFSTNFIFELNGSLQSARCIATNVPLRTTTGEWIFVDLDLLFVARGEKAKSMDKFGVEQEGFRTSSILKLFLQPASLHGAITLKSPSLQPYLGDSVTFNLPENGVDTAAIGNSSWTWHRISTPALDPK